MSYKVTGVFIAAIAIVLLSFAGTTKTAEKNFHATTPLAVDSADGNISAVSAMYSLLNLDSLGLKETAFILALKGWEKLKIKGLLTRDMIMTIADFSQPSTKKRLYVIDMDAKKILYHTYVAHGRNSGKEQAKFYSNKPSSYKSSPGFYVTENSYYGSNGYSLRLEGLERGINDNADRRAIVLHGADYVNENFIRQQGYIGRSQGCPAVPSQMAEPIINTIKNGTCLFIYTPVPSYAKNSKLIR
jgi:hypothetical protein